MRRKYHQIELMKKDISLTREEILLMLRQGKSNSRLFMNTALIGVAFTVFALLVSFQSGTLISNEVMTMQLVLAIPFLLTSTLANSKLSYTLHERHWDTLGWCCFIIGYGFLLNVVGIFVFFLLGFTPAILFFLVNIALMLIYSFVQISYDKRNIERRLAKDIVFILILLVFGIAQIL
jgi:hypothetical protein